MIRPAFVCLTLEHVHWYVLFPKHADMSVIHEHHLVAKGGYFSHTEVSGGTVNGFLPHRMEERWLHAGKRRSSEVPFSLKASVKNEADGVRG